MWYSTTMGRSLDSFSTTWVDSGVALAKELR
jgi:hypothetical protein